ncbi:MAG: LysM peptidoglycan-binding domain-containing protein [Chloroflexi bacterium]|nr:LysM peptidoglycan-binding domain-containing protein [Chloroflexota bacterium]
MGKRRVILSLLLFLIAALLPAAALAAPPAEGPVSYVVQRGDTLGTIARQYGVDYRAIAQANNLANPDLIIPGQRLTIPAPGTVAVRAASHSGLTGRLVFQLASGGPIYTVNADGTNLRHIADGLDPSWSPDGKRIAYANWVSPGGIYVAGADGSYSWRVFDWPSAKTPAWSPDGKAIVFTRQIGPTHGDIEKCFSFFGRSFCMTSGPDARWRLGLIEADTWKFRDLLSWDHSFSPTWMPDNQTIVYDSDKGLHKTARDDSFGAPDVHLPYVNSVTLDTHDMDPRVSPDGTHIAVTYRQHDHLEIHVINADGSGRRRLTFGDGLGVAKPANNAAPVWSPDGKQIAFVSDRDGRWRFYIMNADGSNQRPLFAGTEVDALPLQYGFANERVMDWTGK